MTAWSHLPNAVHIDRILASVRANPDRWDVAWQAVWNAAYDVAWDDAHSAAAWSARGAIYALVAWDHSGAILDLPPDAVRVLAALGDDAAVLLLTAVTAMAEPVAI